MDAATVQKSILAGDVELSENSNPPKDQAQPNAGKSQPELLILFGSNTGTCQTLAQRLSSDAEGHGFRSKVVTMDSGIAEIQSGNTSAVVIVTASYEGQPPDNAAHFVEWVNQSDNLNFHSLQYSVFGCGHSDWATTFLRIPTLVDQKLAQA